MKFVFIILCITLLGTTSGQPQLTSTAFKCSTSGAKCKGIVGYMLPNTTTLAALKRQFTVDTLEAMLEVNNLPVSTKGSHIVEGNQTVNIPFPCLCSNGTGVSDHRPKYTVVPDDGLYHIAMDVYRSLVRSQEIAAVNGIAAPDYKILVGQSLWIPLPCSCDDVDGEKVVHYGHVVQSGSTVSGIAQQFNVPQATLMTLNNISTPKDLLAGQVLDVPLQTCASKVNTTSLDYPILLTNGTYTVTANKCVKCECNAANNYTLHCEPSGLHSSKSSKCGTMKCLGSSNLTLGNNVTYSACSSTSCAYAGYTAKSGVLTVIDQFSTCPVNSSTPTPAPAGSTKNQASKTFVHNWSVAFIGFLSAFLMLIFHS